MRSVDRKPVGEGKRGPITEKIQSRFFGIVEGDRVIELALEGWRGEVMVALHTDSDGRLARVHPHDPSWQNWPALEHAIITDRSFFPESTRKKLSLLLKEPRP